MKTIQKMTILLAIIVMGQAWGATTFYSATSGNWTNGATWNRSGAIPTSTADTIYITDINHIVTVDSAVTNGSYYIGSQSATYGINGGGTLVVSNTGCCLIAGLIYMTSTNNNPSSLRILDGGLVITNAAQDLNIGNENGANNNYLVVAGTNASGQSSCLAARRLLIGFAAVTNCSAVVSNSGSLYLGGYIYVGKLAASASNYLFVGKGGTVNTPEVDVGYAGIGNHMTITDTGSVCRCSLNVGYTSGSVGNRLVVSNGAAIYGSGKIYIGRDVGANSNSILVTGSGSVLTNNDTLLVGGFNSTIGSATGNLLRVENAGWVATPALSVAIYSNCANNGVLLAGGGLLEAGAITVGKDATTTGNYVTNSGGILQFTGYLPTISINSGGVIVMNGGTLSYLGIQSAPFPNLTNNWGATGVAFTSPWSGTNTFRLDNSLATNSVAAGYTFVNNLGSTNYAGLELINGTVGIRGKGVTIGDSTPSHGGSLLVSNIIGTAMIEGRLTNYSPNVVLASVASLVASNGIVWIGGSAATTTAGTVTFGAYTTNQLAGGTVIWNQSDTTATQVMSGVVMGNGGLVKNGPGVLVLAASNSYAGATTVSNGTLMVNGSVNSAVTVVSGAALGGTGTVYGAVTNRGVIKATIYNATGGASLLTVSGSLDITGATLDLAGTNNLASSANIYTIIHATGGVSGTFANGDTILPRGWRLSYGSDIKLMPGYPGTLIMFR